MTMAHSYNDASSKEISADINKHMNATGIKVITCNEQRELMPIFTPGGVLIHASLSTC